MKLLDKIAKAMKKWKVQTYKDEESYELYAYAYSSSDELSILAALQDFAPKLIFLDSVNHERIYNIDNSVNIIVKNM